MSERLYRVDDALQLARSLEINLAKSRELEQTIETVSTVLKDIRKHQEPDRATLESLGVGALGGYTLRMRLLGLLSMNQNKLHKVKSEIKREVKMLDKISICPYCNGSGEIQSHSYERFDRMIYSKVTTQKCENCNGTGKIKLGEEIERIVKTIQSQIEIIIS